MQRRTSNFWLPFPFSAEPADLTKPLQPSHWPGFHLATLHWMPRIDADETRASPSEWNNAIIAPYTIRPSTVFNTITVWRCWALYSTSERAKAKDLVLRLGPRLRTLPSFV